jgi:hypothetical protein
MKYNHIGIPTKGKLLGKEIHLPHLKMYVTDHEMNEHKIQWMRFEDNAPYPELVLTTPHLAFEVADIDEAIKGKEVIIPPNSPSEGLIVCMINDQGVPVEYMQYTK